MKVLDLFSGIGGFSLGLHRAGMTTVAFCECEPYPQAVLRKNFPGVPIYEDVCAVTAEKLRADGIEAIDVVTGGFPCQDLSIAGAETGLDGARSGLWKELCRIISEVRPKYAIVENVTNLLTGGGGDWFSRLLKDLASIGYDAEWHVIPAAAIGALHSRSRVWIVAYPAKVGWIDPEHAESPVIFGEQWRREEVSVARGIACDQGSFRQEVRASEFIRTANGIPGNMDSIRAYGNSIVPQIAEIIGRAIMAADARVI